MTIIDFAVEDIQDLAEKLIQAQSEMEGISVELDRVVKAVEPKWGGDSRQAFMRFYAEWRKGVATHSEALKNTAEKLRQLAEAHQQFG